MPGVHIGARVDQDPRDLAMAARRGPQQRGVAAAHLGVHVGLGGDQGFHHLQVAVRCCLRQRVGMLGRASQISARGDQILNDCDMAVRRRP